jgi:hypothetical protein
MATVARRSAHAFVVFFISPFARGRLISLADPLPAVLADPLPTLAAGDAGQRCMITFPTDSSIMSA